MDNLCSCQSFGVGLVTFSWLLDVCDHTGSWFITDKSWTKCDTNVIPVAQEESSESFPPQFYLSYLCVYAYA